MAAPGKWKQYQSAGEYCADGTFDLDDGADWKCALFLSAGNANDLAASDVYGELTSEHAQANGYTTGGVALANVTWVRSGNVTTFDCDSIVFTASGGSIVARYAVIYKNATVNTIVKPLLCVCVLDTAPADVTVTTGNTLTLTTASGVLTFTGAAVD